MYDTDGDKENFDVENPDYDTPQSEAYDSRPVEKEDKVETRKERIERRPKSGNTPLTLSTLLTWLDPDFIFHLLRVSQ